MFHCILGSRDQWELPPFFRGHAQSPSTALTTDILWLFKVWDDITYPFPKFVSLGMVK